MPRQTTHICSKETEIELLKRDNKEIKKLLTDIHYEIVGNGKPGLKSDVHTLKIIQEQQVQTLQLHNRLVNNLNLKLASYGGAIGMIVFLITFLGNHFMR